MNLYDLITNKKFVKSFAYVCAFLFAVYFGYRWDQAKKLDAYYLEQLQTIKSRMIYGSSVDSQEELGRYQDHIEVCMHLDGYNGPQIMELRCKAFENVVLKGGK